MWKKTNLKDERLIHNEIYAFLTFSVLGPSVNLFHYLMVCIDIQNFLFLTDRSNGGDQERIESNLRQILHRRLLFRRTTDDQVRSL